MKTRNGGFVLVEFAIALPLLVLLIGSLSLVSVNLLKVAVAQLADYTLEEEAKYVMERIIQEVRVAEEIKIDNASNKIKIVYHSVEDLKEGNSYLHNERYSADDYYMFKLGDVLETRYIFSAQKKDRKYKNLYAERQSEIYKHPITSESFFGDTELISLNYELNESKKILHIELKMRSIETNRTITFATAVFMPNYKKESPS